MSFCDIDMFVFNVWILLQLFESPDDTREYNKINYFGCK